MQMTAALPDANGNPLPGGSFTWTSSDPSIASVSSSGLVTGIKLGLVTISVRSGGNTSTANVQVLPASISIVPKSVTLTVGATQRFTATAYGKNGTPVPGVNWTWSASAYRGQRFPTPWASIDSSGLLTAKGVGTYFVQAAVVYNVGTPFVTQLTDTATVQIKAVQPYRTEVLLSSRTVLPSPVLTPRETILAASGNGQLYFIGGMDGVGAALLNYDGQSFRNVIGLSDPGGIAGSRIEEFSEFSVNSSGQVLITMANARSADTIYLGTPGNMQVAVVAGQSPGPVDLLTGVRLLTHRFSLSVSGSFVYQSGFSLGGTAPETGIFRQDPGGRVVLVASSLDTLPGLAGRPSFPTPTQFALTGDTSTIFRAVGTNGAAWFRSPANDAPSRLFGVGSTLGTSTVTGIPSNFQGRYNDANVCAMDDGGFVVSAHLANGRVALAWYTPDGKSAPAILELNQFRGIYDCRAGQGVLLYGATSSPAGLYRWDGSNKPPALVVALNSKFLNDEPIVSIDGAAVDAEGSVFGLIKTATHTYVTAKLSPQQSVLFESGAPLRTPGLFNIYQMTPQIHGSGDPVAVSVAGWQSNLYDAKGKRPMMLSGTLSDDGDLLKPLAWQGAKIAPDGRLFASVPGVGVEAVSPSGVSKICPFIMTLDDGTVVGVQTLYRVYDGGMILAANTGLLRVVNCKPSLLVADGTSPKVTTRTQSGVDVRAINGSETNIAVTDSGRLMMGLTKEDNSLGVFLLQDAGWVEVATPGVTTFGRRPVTGIVGLWAIGEKHFAVFGLDDNATVLAEYAGGQWNPIMDSSTVVPSGDTGFAVSAMDANRNGDLVVSGKGRGSATQFVFVRRANGTLVEVVDTADFSITGSQIYFFSPVNIRDDGTVYSIAVDITGGLFLLKSLPI